MGLKLEDKRIQVYLTEDEEKKGRLALAGYKNPIVIHNTSETSENKHWPLANWEQLVREMPEYTFVQLGLSGDMKVNGAIDLRGKTSFREALAILKSSMSFVGVDSSFAHATNAFDVPGVILFGATTPKVWGHGNNVNLYKSLRCAPCIDILVSSVCPYGKVCMTAISVSEVKDSLMKQLMKRNGHQC
jgi:ADP-heptose:LPS heptosyltransferase